jgi:hypothetical protein
MATKCFFVKPVDNEAGNTDHWIRPDTGEKFSVKSHWDLPVGAMFYATWMEEVADRCGPDGKSIMVITPGGGWMIDGRASNCDSPCKHCGVPYKDHKNEISGQSLPAANSCDQYEDSRPHKCWVRHGQLPLITVDKDGITCGAGSGSILIGEYHGFLKNGELT